jgi:hypothetical protein
MKARGIRRVSLWTVAIDSQKSGEIPPWSMLMQTWKLQGWTWRCLIEFKIRIICWRKTSQVMTEDNLHGEPMLKPSKTFSTITMALIILLSIQALIIRRMLVSL